MQNFNLYKSEFNTAKMKVQDWTAQEELDLLLKQIGHEWCKRVLKAEAKEAARKHALKFTGCPVSAHDLAFQLQKIGIPTANVQQHKGCITLNVPTHEMAEKLVSEPLTYGDVTIQTQHIRDRWTSSQVFDWVSNELKVEHESWILTRGSNSNSTFQKRDDKRVHEIHLDKKPNVHHNHFRPDSRGRPQQQSGKGGKGGKGKGHDRRSNSSGPQNNSTPTSNPSRETYQKGECWICRKNGKPYQHNWLECNVARSHFTKVTGREPIDYSGKPMKKLQAVSEDVKGKKSQTQAKGKSQQ